MDRRAFITMVSGGILAAPLAALAQQKPMPVIGVLSPEEPTTPYVGGLRAGLQEMGYLEGRNIQIEYRWAQGKFKRLPDLAAELVRLNVDVIVTYVTQASLEAKKQTSTIPIVMVGVADPVGVGLIASLAHPGGNVTGTSSVAAALVGKQFELLKEIVPKVSRIAALWNPANPAFQALQVRQAEIAARKLGIQLQLLEARAPNEFDAAFAAIDREGTRALIILAEPLWDNNSNTHTLVELVAKRRLAAIAGHRAFADAGGLVAYGANYFNISKLAAVYVDKILKGVKPADLPVEQPTKYELVINLKTAKALGLTLPQSILVRADEIIQ
jgi:putative ABC transport system substrate-binding protein